VERAIGQAEPREDVAAHERILARNDDEERPGPALHVREAIDEEIHGELARGPRMHHRHVALIDRVARRHDTSAVHEDRLVQPRDAREMPHAHEERTHRARGEEPDLPAEERRGRIGEERRMEQETAHIARVARRELERDRGTRAQAAHARGNGVDLVEELVTEVGVARGVMPSLERRRAVAAGQVRHDEAIPRRERREPRLEVLPRSGPAVQEQERIAPSDLGVRVASAAEIDLAQRHIHRVERIG
jgi:hypothetical protein